MKVSNFLFFYFLILTACNDLPFKNEEVESLTEETIKEIPKNKDEFLEDEITLIEENMELTENTIIQNKRVILNMVTIKTFEYDLLIKADEFISNHSIIQNFEENEKARKNEDGKNGGSTLIETNTAKGELKLILNGENGGHVSSRKLSLSEKTSLRGQDGRNGQNAIYRVLCDTWSFLGFEVSEYCANKCMVAPRQGENGGNGKRGLTGFSGKNGGNSGSFYLKAFQLSDFHLTEIKQNPGVSSEGGRGSRGGDGGSAGKNGTDRKRLCRYRLSRPKNGNRGSSGRRGLNGKDGVTGIVCLEKLKEEPKHLYSNNQTVNKPQNNNSTKENTICY
ncbi:MAG: hypothetical protein OXK80_05720 [Bdellovibrionales bacterium]|nr:hypothetical protein [Bdellovibrionales bacterium]